MLLKDAHNRIIRDLRVSLTDRCNFRCFYCLPNGEPPLARKDTILTFEELEYICEIFVSLGIEKIRLTGGEPLLRKDVEKLVEKIAVLKPDLKDLALTTNGFSLEKRAVDLKNAGLDRVTISLDSLKPEKFKKIRGGSAIRLVLHQHLWREQKGLCAYCEQEVPEKTTPENDAKSHLEHIRPKARSEFKHLTFHFENIVISCEGFDLTTVSEHKKGFCGHFKDNDFTKFDDMLFLNPTEIT